MLIIVIFVCMRISVYIYICMYIYYLFISVPTITVSRIFEATSFNENIAIILVTRNNVIQAMRLTRIGSNDFAWQIGEYVKDDKTETFILSTFYDTSPLRHHRQNEIAGFPC